jgi:hypothetical protein
MACWAILLFQYNTLRGQNSEFLMLQQVVYIVNSVTEYVK